MVIKRDNRPTTTTDRVNIEQSASGRWALGRQSFAICFCSRKFVHQVCFAMKRGQGTVKPYDTEQCRQKLVFFVFFLANRP